jgi:hypothetical protein
MDDVLRVFIFACHEEHPMPNEISLKTASRRLPSLLEDLQIGDSLTLLDAEGRPVALVVSLRAEKGAPPSQTDWESEWDELSREVGKVWKDSKSAAEAVAEQRR